MENREKATKPPYLRQKQTRSENQLDKYHHNVMRSNSFNPSQRCYLSGTASTNREKTRLFSLKCVYIYFELSN